MIVDSLSNLKCYNSINKRFDEVCQYLATVDLTTLTEGKYIIDADNIYMSVVATELRSKEDALLETHNEYIDIQIVISGYETYGWSARSECKSLREAYSSQNDISFYTDSVSTYIDLKPEQMVIFLTEDAHAPLIGDGVVRKCIIKVRNL